MAQRYNPEIVGGGNGLQTDHESETAKPTVKLDERINLVKTNQTKPVRTSRFSVRGPPSAVLLRRTGWMLNVAVLATAVSALADVHYVDANSTNATPPYISWATAAANIQDAVDAAVAGDEIVVTNGIYATGGRAMDGVTNRVLIDKPVTVRSVNGPLFTAIDGGHAVRCVYLANSTILSGFTLTNGNALGPYPSAGGGALCESPTAVISNCVVTSNRADSAGGVFAGALYYCTLSGNSAEGGGGAWNSTLDNCTLSGNSAVWGSGGGAIGCMLNNCTLTGNSARPGDFGHGGNGGGAYGSTLNNCTLTGNSAVSGGGGAWNCTLNNCIVYFNNGVTENYRGCTLNYCSTTPLPQDGVGNITNAPLFVDLPSGNLRLQSNSPCINAGLNAFAPTGPDLDGNPRIVGGAVDMGAYEFQSPTPIPAQLTITASGTNVILMWPTNYAEVVIHENHYEAYFLYSTTNLVSPVVWRFVYSTPVVVNGHLGVTNSIDNTQRFYRIAKVTGPLGEVPCLRGGPNPCPCAFTCVSGVWTEYAQCRSCDDF
jgi:hypothetical protein